MNVQSQKVITKINPLALSAKRKAANAEIAVKTIVINNETRRKIINKSYEIFELCELKMIGTPTPISRLKDNVPASPPNNPLKIDFLSIG